MQDGFILVISNIWICSLPNKEFKVFDHVVFDSFVKRRFPVDGVLVVDICPVPNEAF